MASDCGAMRIPDSHNSYVTLARHLASSGRFVTAEPIRHVLERWPQQRAQWWTKGLETQVESLCLSARIRVQHIEIDQFIKSLRTVPIDPST